MTFKGMTEGFNYRYGQQQVYKEPRAASFKISAEEASVKKRSLEWLN